MTNSIVLCRDRFNDPENLQRIADVAAGHVKPATVVRFALRAMQKVPKLADCTFNSLLLALMDAAACGLEPDGRKGHLVPFGKDAVFVPGYQGLIDRMREGAAIQDVWAHVVYEGDTFSHTLGDAPKLLHIPDYEHSEYGNIQSARGVYACVRLSNGAVHPEFIPAKRVLSIRSGVLERGRGRPSPWSDRSEFVQGEMWRKTAVRAVAKYIPYNVDLAALLLHAEDAERAHEVRRADVEVVDTENGRGRSRLASLPAPSEYVNGGAKVGAPDPRHKAGVQTDPDYDPRTDPDHEHEFDATGEPMPGGSYQHVDSPDLPDRSTLDGLIGMTRYCQATKRIHQLMIENGLEAETVATLLDEFAAASEKAGKWVQIKDIPAGGIRERFADAVRDHIDRMAAATAGGDDGHAGNGAS